MKNVYLWNLSVVTGKVVPVLWFAAKTYFEEHGTNVNEWTWHDPFINELSDEEILEYCKQNPPNIFGFSVYVWSQNKANSLSQKIKHQHPECLIIYGGPQIDIKYSDDFFIKYPWVDLVVPSDVYGEYILNEILNNFDNLKYHEIPEVYYHRGGIKFKSKHAFAKRSYVWPTNIFEAQKEYFNFDKTNSLVVYESSRGCPYKCSYCDWGGGTYTKVNKKPLATVLDELEFLCKNKIEFIYIADANFGIFKEDIDIIKHIAKLKKKYGYPLGMSVENAKNNLDRVIEIQRILMKNQLSSYYKISIQNPHDDIKKNIDRIDIPFEEQILAVQELRKEYSAPILIETIIGLPGDSYQKTLESIDIFDKYAVDTHRPAIWNLLPEAPAYAPAERAKWKIETKLFEIVSFPYRVKPGYDIDANVSTMSLTENRMILENVIGTSSYSKFDWCDMLAITTLAGVGNIIGFNFFTVYLNNKHRIPSSFFYDKLYKKIISEQKFNTDFLNKSIGNFPKQLYDVVTDPKLNKIEFDITPTFPLLLSANTYITFLIMLEPTDFFTTIGDYFSIEFNDPALKDLGRYLANIMIDLDYNPKIKRSFTTEYNWYSYFNNNSLTKASYDYTILDEQLKFVGNDQFDYSDYPDEQNYDQKIKQFFYHRASNGARKKYAEHIIENEILQTTK